MKKPVIYYQYDKKEFLEKHIGSDYKKTYFKYENDCFGPIANNEEELLKELNKNFSQKSLEKEYLDKIDSFFPLCDSKNCERIYEEVRRG